MAGGCSIVIMFTPPPSLSLSSFFSPSTVPPLPDKIDIGFIQSEYMVDETRGEFEVCAEPTQSETVLTRDLGVMLRAEPGTAGSE